MAKFTNYTHGPKGLNTVAGLVYVDAGKSVDVEISDEEAAVSKKTGWFSKPKHPLDHDGDDKAGGFNPGEGNELADMTVNDLKALAEAEAIDLGDATKKADIVAAIELAREAKTEG